MIQLADLLEAMAPARARLVGPPAASQFDGFAYDSRKVRPGEVFLAVRTARADGHDYIADAIRRGAVGVIGDRLGDEAARLGVTAVAVEETQDALRAWARWALTRYAPRVVAMVGGVGKTSAAKAAVGVLGHGVSADPTVFDGDNHNTFYGLSIALGELSAAHQVAVLELAGDEPGDLVALADLTRPTTVVVVSAYASAARNRELAEVMARVPFGGHLILNADDARLSALFDEARERIRATVIRYGHSPSARRLGRGRGIGPGRNAICSQRRRAALGTFELARRARRLGGSRRRRGGPCSRLPRRGDRRGPGALEPAPRASPSAPRSKRRGCPRRHLRRQSSLV